MHEFNQKRVEYNNCWKRRLINVLDNNAKIVRKTFILEQNDEDDEEMLKSRRFQDSNCVASFNFVHHIQHNFFNEDSSIWLFEMAISSQKYKYCNKISKYSEHFPSVSYHSTSCLVSPSIDRCIT